MLSEEDGEVTAQALRETLISTSEEDRRGDPANVVDGLMAIAVALTDVARAINRLGNADAATPIGGMEALGMTLGEGLQAIARAIAEAEKS